MKRFAIVVFGMAALTMAASSAFAQSGTRGGGGSAGGGGGGSAGAGYGGEGSGSGFGGSRFRDADILTGQSQVIRSVGQRNYFNAVGIKEYESARRLYIENQIVIQQQRQAYKDRKELEKQQRKARHAMRRMEQETKKAQRLAKALKINWPDALKKSKYDKYRAEIESLGELYAKLDENSGVEVGLKQSIRNLAQRIIKDEKAGLIQGEALTQVRSFVRNLNKNRGQIPGPMEMKVQNKGMLAKKM